MVSAIVVTSPIAGHYLGCTVAVSFGFWFGRPFKHSLGGGDGRLGWLDDGVTAAFGQDVPGWAEVYLVWVFGGDSRCCGLSC
jgi:hypothetical protein